MILVHYLEKALIVAKKLKIKNFEEWINNELKGYTSNIPNYRKISGKLFFYDPYQGYIPALGDKTIDKFLNNLPINQKINELEYMIKSDDKYFYFLMSDEISLKITKLFKVDLMPYMMVSSHAIKGILDEVKTIILEWALKLEEEGIKGEENMSFSNKEKEIAQKNSHINIENFIGTIGDIKDSQNLSIANNNKINQNTKLNELLNNLKDEIKKLNIEDKNEIIKEIELNKNNHMEIQKIIGSLMTRGAETVTLFPIFQAIIKNIPV